MASSTDIVEPAHYHHFHLNVIDPAASIKFYKEFLGAVDVKYRGVSDALFTERSYILLTKVDTPSPPSKNCILTHAGWSGIDGPTEYEWLKSKGIRFETPATLIDDNAHYMYFYGPDDELLEVYTGNRNHRFEHFHHNCIDINAAALWYQENLGLKAVVPFKEKPTVNLFRTDNINLIFHGRAPLKEGEEFEPSEGHVIDHIAFSYRDIDPAFERMKANGVEIVRPIEKSEEFGHRSFFVHGPEKVLVEVVEDKPVPEGIWD